MFLSFVSSFSLDLMTARYRDQCEHDGKTHVPVTVGQIIHTNQTKYLEPLLLYY